MAPLVALADLARVVVRDGFVFVEGADLRARLERLRPGALRDWDAFAASWDGLKRDEYMADGRRDRLRRHAVFSIPAGETAPRLEPHRPHYQDKAYNPLNGGVERWYEPIEPDVAKGAILTAVLEFGADLFRIGKPGASWLVEAHQFRIEPAPGGEGRPTPEGMHRDGVDYAIALMVARVNVRRGTTHVGDLAGRPLGSFTLAGPLDAAIVDDARVLHGVTPITAVDPALPARRDVLVATYRAV